MSKENLLVITLAALLGVVFALNIFTPRVSKGASLQLSNFSDLTLRISTLKGDFLQLEPVPITLELSNETDHPIVGHTAIDFSLHHIKLFVRQSGGRLKEVKELSPSKERVRVSKKEIVPGERHKSKQILTLDLGTIFPVPEVYEIQAVLYDAAWRDKVKSNVTTIKVISPEGGNKEAFEFIKNHPTAPYFFSVPEITGNAEMLKTLEDFEASFSESTYGGYASFQLGKFYFFRGEYAKAGEKLEKVAKKKDFAFADTAEEYLAKVKAKLTKHAQR